jgi:excisionase family DNA binding protein
MNDPPYSPKKLAARWGCTPQFVHKLIRNGQLKHFKLGAKLVRIPAEEVARWEAQQTTSSESSTGEKSSPGGRGINEIAFASVMASRRGC